MGSISLATALVAGRKRVPMPATGNTALRTARVDLRIEDAPLSGNTSFRFAVADVAEMLMTTLLIISFYIDNWYHAIKTLRMAHSNKSCSTYRTPFFSPYRIAERQL